MNGKPHHSTGFIRIGRDDDDATSSAVLLSADAPLNGDDVEQEGGTERGRPGDEEEVELGPAWWSSASAMLKLGLVVTPFLLLLTFLLLFLPISLIQLIRVQLGLNSAIDGAAWSGSAVNGTTVNRPVVVDSSWWVTQSGDRSSRPSSAEALLTESEAEVAFMLTGEEGAGSRWSEESKALLRRAVAGVSLSLSSIRPSIQSDLWLTECLSALPCPFPDLALREAAPPNSTTDDDVIDRLTHDHLWLPSWMESWAANSTATPPLFHSPSRVAQHGVPSPVIPLLVPGEVAEGQAVALRFQSDLYAQQHPQNCSTAPIMMMDFYLRWGGFGSWSHGRAVALMVGMRAGRTVVEVEGIGGYHQAYSDCTRTKGLGGCDIFLPASSCPFPQDWVELIRLDKLSWSLTHTELPSYTSLSHHLDHIKDRRIIAYTELADDGEMWELHHVPRKGWSREELAAWTTGPLAYLRHLPECWYNRQALAYQFRLTRPAEVRLLTEVARSLRLPDPPQSAATALRYADTRCQDLQLTAHWWMSIQTLKLHWQIHQIHPQLLTHLAGQTNGDDLALSEALSPPVDAVPLLCYAFIRHGDKSMETKLLPDELYFQMMTKLSHTKGLRSWYVGSDDLLAPDHIRSLNTPSEALLLFTSSLVDDIENKTGHPLASGFMWSVESLTDEVREGVVWRTMVEFGVGQIADVFFSTWSSNHPRMVYELSTALSDARATAPMIALDSVAAGDGMHVILSKYGKVQGC